jgi:hypothetical protein
MKYYRDMDEVKENIMLKEETSEYYIYMLRPRKFLYKELHI